jgi:predicted dehydrogenase
MIKLGIVGTGGMANWHVESFKKAKGCRIVAACDIDQGRVDAFGDRHGIRARFTDVAAMLDAADMDAISVVTTDAAHAPVSLEAIRRGYHVLCEKPLALNYADARKMAQAAERKGVINMVNFSYRKSAALQRAAELVGSGALGRVLHFEASYLQSWLSTQVWGDWRTNPGWLWRLSTRHGSKGVLGDIGVHIIDMASFVTGPLKRVNCKLKTFREIKGRRLGEYPLDANDSAIIHCELSGGGLGVIHATRWATGHANSLRLRVYCERGAAEIDLDKSYMDLNICEGDAIHKAEWRTIRCKCKDTPDPIARFVRSIRKGENDQPDFRRGAEVQKVLDACFESDREGKAVSVR